MISENLSKYQTWPECIMPLTAITLILLDVIIIEISLGYDCFLHSTVVLLALIAAVRVTSLKLNELLWVLESMCCWYCYWLLNNDSFMCKFYQKFLSIDFPDLWMNLSFRMNIHFPYFFFPWLNGLCPLYTSTRVSNKKWFWSFYHPLVYLIEFHGCTASIPFYQVKRIDAICYVFNNHFHWRHSKEIKISCQYSEQTNLSIFFLLSISLWVFIDLYFIIVY